MTDNVRVGEKESNVPCRSIRWRPVGVVIIVCGALVDAGIQVRGRAGHHIVVPQGNKDCITELPEHVCAVTKCDVVQCAF